MKYFVESNSIVRQIWGKGDTILLIFAGAAAEFALNKAVDWLYFTKKLPADPLGRLFTTVSYARTIVFSEEKHAFHAIDTMNAIHSNVEKRRGDSIPDRAYRDVLFMLIDYSIRSFEVLERKLTLDEKEEVLCVFNRLGNRMCVKDLPVTFQDYECMRQLHMNENLQHNQFTDNLFRQYRKHLGIVRYRILLESQNLIVPGQVRRSLGFRRTSLLKPLILFYKLFRKIKFDKLLKELILPAKYKNEIKELDVAPF